MVERVPELTPEWWDDLERRLRADAPHAPGAPDVPDAPDAPDAPGEASRRTVDPIALCRRIWVIFGVDVDTDVRRWRGSRGGLTWNDLRPRAPVLADRATVALAPRGFDAASLLAHSLAVPPIAEQVAHRFRDELATEDGIVSQLYLLASALIRAETGEHPALVDPIHRHVDRLIGRPRLLRPTTA